MKSRSNAPLAACAAVFALLAACSDSTGTPDAGPRAAGLQADTLLAPPGTTLAVRLVDSAGSVVSARGVRWRSSDSDVASVDGSGQVTSRKFGSAMISARVRDTTFTATLWVVPQAIHACETSTVRFCSVWLLNGGSHYDALWPEGSVSVIRVERFDAAGVVFSRLDSSGSLPGMRAMYRGTPTEGGVLNGTVAWTPPGYLYSFPGPWEASW